ncbi:hypothetical protein [Streptomyces sp. MBT62]|uniref:hypothetical protein n=1 Tax=Streptomyces sp. MBT62 TaxID=2800410 RepID=UPI00190C1707|nr:hypothetical protein [Streptomyces sp. MBT62]MBK3571965.1 hypothetical protein [Streptomyces sp. MBT62]
MTIPVGAGPPAGRSRLHGEKARTSIGPGLSMFSTSIEIVEAGVGLTGAQARGLQERVDSYLSSTGGTQVSVNRILLRRQR